MGITKIKYTTYLSSDYQFYHQFLQQCIWWYYYFPLDYYLQNSVLPIFGHMPVIQDLEKINITIFFFDGCNKQYNKQCRQGIFFSPGVPAFWTPAVVTISSKTCSLHRGTTVPSGKTDTSSHSILVLPKFSQNATKSNDSIMQDIDGWRLVGFHLMPYHCFRHSRFLTSNFQCFVSSIERGCLALLKEGVAFFQMVPITQFPKKWRLVGFHLIPSKCTMCICKSFCVKRFS